jgi:hypothetical protein
MEECGTLPSSLATGRKIIGGKEIGKATTLVHISNINGTQAGLE